MINGLVEPPFKLTHDEIILSAVITVCLLELTDNSIPPVSVGKLIHKPQYGFTASAISQPIGPRFVRITDIKAGSIEWDNVPYCECSEVEKYALDAGDILVARAGSVGKTFLVSEIPEPAVFASYMIRLQTKGKALPEYIYWCMQSQQFWHQIMNASRGSAMKNINAKMLISLEFPFPEPTLQALIVEFMEAFEQYLLGYVSDLPSLPQPLPDLPKIASRIEELAAHIEEARGLRQQAVEETEVLLKSTLDVVFEELERTYASITIGKKGGFVTSGPRGWGKYYDDNGGRRLIRAQNIRDGKIDVSNSARVTLPSSAGDVERSQIRPGDILITITGATTGQVGVVWDLDLPSHVSQHVALMRPPETILPDYLCWYLRSPEFGKTQTVGQRYGATKPGLNLTTLRNLSVAAPNPHKQREIVAYLDDLQARVDELKHLQADTAAELDALLPSILDKAFKGEL